MFSQAKAPKKHSAWFAPLLMNNLKERVTAVEAIISSDGKNKPKYVGPLQKIKQALSELDAINEAVVLKGPYKVNDEGQPLVKNREIQFVDEIDDPNLNSIFNTIKTQINLIVAASANTFKPQTRNHELIMSLHALCEDFFNKYHRASKQEIEKRFFVEFYLAEVNKTKDQEVSVNTSSAALSSVFSSGSQADHVELEDIQVDLNRSKSSSHSVVSLSLSPSGGSGRADGSTEKSSPSLLQKRELGEERNGATASSSESTTDYEPRFPKYLAQDSVHQKLAANRARLEKVLTKKDQLVGEVCRLFNDLPGYYSAYAGIAKSYFAVKTMDQADSELGVEFEESTWLSLVVATAYYEMFDDNGALLPALKKQLGDNLLANLYTTLDEATVNHALLSSYFMHMASALTADPQLIALDKEKDKTDSPLVTLGRAFNSLVSQIKADKKSIQSYKGVLLTHTSHPVHPVLKENIVALNERFKQRGKLEPLIGFSEWVGLEKAHQELQVVCATLQQQLKVEKERLEQQQALLETYAIEREHLEKRLKETEAELIRLSTQSNDLGSQKTKLGAELQSERELSIEQERQLSKLRQNLQSLKLQAELAEAELRATNKKNLEQLAQAEKLIATQKLRLEQLAKKQQEQQATIQAQTEELFSLRKLPEQMAQQATENERIRVEERKKFDRNLLAFNKVREDLEKLERLRPIEQSHYRELQQSYEQLKSVLTKQTEELAHLRRLPQELSEAQASEQVAQEKLEHLEEHNQILQAELDDLRQKQAPIIKSVQREAEAKSSDEGSHEELRELQNQNAALLRANRDLRVQLKHSQLRAPIRVPQPQKTPWWKYALAAVAFGLGLLTLVTGVLAALAVPLLAFSISTAAGVGMAMGGAVMIASSGAYMGVKVRADKREQEAYTRALKNAAIPPRAQVSTEHEEREFSSEAAFEMHRPDPVERPSVTHAFYRSRPTTREVATEAALSRPVLTRSASF